MSHYDVVPAPSSTFDRWTYPPFSGHNDGEYIWGRGAADDKTLLVAQCESARVDLVFFDEKEADCQGSRLRTCLRTALSRDER